MVTLEDGFATIAGCFTVPECDSLIERLDPISRAGTRCLLEHDWCRACARMLRSRVANLIPEVSSLVAVQCTYFNKLPERNWLVAYHQDRSIPVALTADVACFTGASEKEGMTFVHGPDELLERMLALRLHLDDCTPDNGPLRVLPHTHRRGTLSSQAIADLRNAADDEELCVEKGGIIAMRPLLLHASSKSRSAKQRRVLHFLFAPTVLPAGLEWRHAV